MIDKRYTLRFYSYWSDGSNILIGYIVWLLTLCTVEVRVWPINDKVTRFPSILQPVNRGLEWLIQKILDKWAAK